MLEVGSYWEVWVITVCNILTRTFNIKIQCHLKCHFSQLWHWKLSRSTLLEDMTMLKKYKLRHVKYITLIKIVGTEMNVNCMLHVPKLQLAYSATILSLFLEVTIKIKAHLIQLRGTTLIANAFLWLSLRCHQHWDDSKRLKYQKQRF